MAAREQDIKQTEDLLIPTHKISISDVPGGSINDNPAFEGAANNGGDK